MIEIMAPLVGRASTWALGRAAHEPLVPDPRQPGAGDRRGPGQRNRAPLGAAVPRWCPRGGCISVPAELFSCCVIHGWSPAPQPQRWLHLSARGAILLQHYTRLAPVVPQRWLHLSARQAVLVQRYTRLVPSTPAPEAAASQRQTSRSPPVLYTAGPQHPSPRGGCISAPDKPFSSSVIHGWSPAPQPQRQLHLSARQAVLLQHYTRLVPSTSAPEVAASQHQRSCSPAALYTAGPSDAPEAAASQRQTSRSPAALYTAVPQWCPRGGCISALGKPSLCDPCRACAFGRTPGPRAHPQTCPLHSWPDAGWGLGAGPGGWTREELRIFIVG
ncbi:uncharacterized protein LOC127036875 [Gopherus flavomarginatus]|uniref:uncharacterized protein LOC127036875 n=1 Tax=Gopherus flavomarginatus TaxID=286002 RepID=UPI0021CBD038|nr:uncharacterized protein LOC127036875 [Gopherus flavomarginatus]